MTAGVLPKAGIKLSEYQDLKSISIAVPLGVSFDEKFHNDKTLNKVRPPKYINALRMLAKGRVDSVAGPIANLYYIADRIGIARSSFDAPLIFIQNDVYLTCTRSLDKNIRQALKKTLTKLKSSGEIQRILDKYDRVAQKSTGSLPSDQIQSFF